MAAKRSFLAAWCVAQTLLEPTLSWHLKFATRFWWASLAPSGLTPFQEASVLCCKSSIDAALPLHIDHILTGNSSPFVTVTLKSHSFSEAKNGLLVDLLLSCSQRSVVASCTQRSELHLLFPSNFLKALMVSGGANTGHSWHGNSEERDLGNNW